MNLILVIASKHSFLNIAVVTIVDERINLSVVVLTN